tara:strand:- start:3852 stop:5777 length:1926 start_codon:yes stop_codon:yes gene_type:complete
MCGIVGFNWDDKILIKNMADSINHRGPDQDGYFTDDSISLGHKRLSIIDLSENGRQPIYNEDNTMCLIFNGEIYNFQELRPMLEERGHKFNSNTDSEVIIHAYEEFGTDCLKLFNGMFTFAIYDSKKKQIFLARDRLGQKFLYYYYQDNKFLFASEIKALLQCEEIKKEFSLSTLSQYITWAYAINGDTFFENIKELQPGRYMIYNLQNNKLQIKKYWDLEDSLYHGYEIKNEQYYIKKLRDLMVKSVERRMIADVPLGASLSGGLDSSLIVGIMSHLKGANIKTYTIGFGREDDEAPFARKVAEHCDTDYNEITLSYNEMTNSMPQVLWSLEMPWARPAQPAIYHLLKELKKHVTVNLVGEGADEFYAGYNRYHVYAPKPKYSPLYEQDDFNKKWWTDFLKYENMNTDDKTKLIASGYFNDHEERDETFAEDVISKIPQGTKIENSFGKLLLNSQKHNELNTVLAFECKSSLEQVQLVKLDKLSMASSLEVRAPFLDHHVAEFAMKIPPILKWNGINKKYVVQKVAEEFIPKQNAFRRKLPLQVPLADYYKTDFIDIIKGLLDEKTLAKRSYMKPERVQKLLAKFKENPNFSTNKSTAPTSDNPLRQLLFLTNLELMQRMFFENDNLKDPKLDINHYLSQ